MTTMKIADIRIDGGTQSRFEINDRVVVEYADAMANGAKMPPVTVFFDGDDYWLADGFHRLGAQIAQEEDAAVGIEQEIEVEILTGTVLDAKLYACAANQCHGLRRTEKDKNRAVAGMLEIVPEWSDNRIAKHVGVSHTFVAAVRNPDVAKRQKQNRDRSAAKKNSDIESDSTRDQQPGAVDSNSRTAPGTPGESPRIDSAEDSSLEDTSEMMNEAEATAYVDGLLAQIDQLQRNNDALSAGDRGAELMKQMQLLLNAENTLNTERERAAVRDKQLKWFGRQYAELRNILDVKNDRDVLAAVRKLVEVRA